MSNLIKELREQTGAGILEVKKALEEAGNDMEKAVQILRKKGAAKLGKKADRAAREGVVTSYIHPGNKIGVLLELNCETDFVGRTEDFQTLANSIAMHIAAANPLYVKIEDVPADVVEKEKEIYKETAKGKPEDVIEKMVTGKLAKYYEEACLLEQPYVKNPDVKIKDLLSDSVAKMGENVQIKRFSRFVLGN